MTEPESVHQRLPRTALVAPSHGAAAVTAPPWPPERKADATQCHTLQCAVICVNYVNYVEKVSFIARSRSLFDLMI